MCGVQQRGSASRLFCQGLLALLSGWVYAAVGLGLALFKGNGGPPEDTGFPAERERMVLEQVVRRGVRDPRVLAAMRKVERHRFVNEAQRSIAYGDHPLPVGEGQTISQPYIVALMTEALRLEGGETVLEVGTGSGYQTAILAEVAEEVYSMELLSSLADRAGTILQELGYTNVHFRVGDGNQGWAEHAPYDSILVTAAPPRMPPKLIEQLAEGGRLVIPVGIASQELEVHTKEADGVRVERIASVRFVPLVGDST